MGKVGERVCQINQRNLRLSVAVSVVRRDKREECMSFRVLRRRRMKRGFWCLEAFIVRDFYFLRRMIS